MIAIQFAPLPEEDFVMTKLPIARPHRRADAASMRHTFEQNAANPLVLVQLLCELILYRSTAAARELQADVIERLGEVLPKPFLWPSTDPPDGHGEVDESCFRHQHGVLALLGYHVGKTGRRANERHALLDFAYANALPVINSNAYMAKWGAPKSGERLQMMAESIAAFVKMAKGRKTQGHQAAISDWEADLAYLKAAYYIGRYSFPWLDTAS